MAELKMAYNRVAYKLNFVRRLGVALASIIEIADKSIPTVLGSP
jgi:hypothetical protein